MSMARPCVERFRGFLQFLWMDNTEDEALVQWRHRIHDFPEEAERDLACLDEIVADPPPDLVSILNEDGWVILSHQPDPETVVDYTPEEYRGWMREMAARFRAEYEAARKP
jgi:hypothetical protein